MCYSTRPVTWGKGKVSNHRDNEYEYDLAETLHGLMMLMGWQGQLLRHALDQVEKRSARDGGGPGRKKRTPSQGSRQ